MILFDVTLATSEEQRPALVDLLRRTMAASQAEPGCLVYRFTVDLDDPLRFHLVELWESEAAFMGHAAGEALRGFIAGLPACGKIVTVTPRKGTLAPYTFRMPSA